MYAYAVIDWRTQKIEDKGIVEAWGECQEKTHKVEGSRFKKFDNIEDAKEWLKNPIHKGKQNYYAVYSPAIEAVFQDYITLVTIIKHHANEHIDLRFRGFEDLNTAKKWLESLQD